MIFGELFVFIPDKGVKEKYYINCYRGNFNSIQKNIKKISIHLY